MRSLATRGRVRECNAGALGRGHSPTLTVRTAMTLPAPALPASWGETRCRTQTARLLGEIGVVDVPDVGEILHLFNQVLVVLTAFVAELSELCIHDSLVNNY